MRNAFWSRATVMLAIATILVFGLTTNTSATVIDDFTDAQAALVTSGGVESSEVCGGSMLGGCRSITVTAAASSGPSTASSAEVESGFLSIDNGVGISSIVEVLWAGVGGAGLVPAGDLSSTIAIVVEVFFADLGMTIDFALEDYSGNTATKSLDIASTQFPGPTGAVQYFFNLGSFISAPGATDLGDLKSVKMTISGDDAYDAAITFVDTTAIPEPATWMLSGLALIGLGLLRRRQTTA